jgi:hypothetical protein
MNEQIHVNPKGVSMITAIKSRMKYWSLSNVSFVMILAALLLTPIITSAQSTSGVTGIVTDSTGAIIPGAQVTLLDTKISRESVTTTNNDGTYSFTNISPGAGYRLTFSAAGFQTYIINDVQLGVSSTASHNAMLTAGQVSEVVEVTSTTGDATLNTADASIGNVIGSRQLRELPIQLRGSPAALIGLQPGAIGNNVGAGGGNRTGSVTGARADQGNITVDGLDSNDVTTGQAFNTVANAPIDSIQEFRAVTSGPNAIDGRSSGGQISLLTQSGTNQFHGNVREYYRTEEAAANSFFNNRAGVARPALQRHQYGGSFGGPLPFFNFGNGGPIFKSGKDRLFFFFDWEARNDDSENVASRTVPRQNFRDGQIAYILATSTAGTGACPSTARIESRPDCVGFLSLAQAAALDPQGVGINANLLSFINSRYPLPNDLSGGNGLNTALHRFNAPNVRDDDIYTGKIDIVPSDNQRIFFRATITRRDSTNALQQFPGDADAVSFADKSYSFVGNHNWVINSNFTNSFTAGMVKQVNLFTPAAAASFPNSFSFGPITAPFASLSYQDRNVFVPTIRDDASYTAGNHNFQFGASYKPIRQKPSLTNDFNFVTLGLGGRTTALNPTLRPADIRTGSVAAYDSAYAFLLGRIGQVATNFTYDQNGNAFPAGSGRKRSYAYNEYEFYLQDNWRLRSDLTVNLGVRYHLYPAPYETGGLQAANDVDFEELVALRLQNAAAGVFGDDAEPLTSFNLSGSVNDGAPLYKTDKNNFSPRIGFAYNPSATSGFLGALFGDRKTVLRGNYSLVYDRPGGAITFIQDQSNFLFDNSVTSQFGNTNATTALLNDPRFTSINTLPIANTPPVITRPFTPFVDGTTPTGLATGELNYVIAKDFEIPYSHTFNFGIQREIPGNMILDVSYVGRLGKKLFVQSDAAQVLNFKDTTSGQFMFDALNQLQAQIQANITAGLPASTGVTNQAWLENQMNPASIATYGVPCSGLGLGASCTQLLANFVPDLVRVGGAADTVATLYSNGLLRSNVGMSGQFATNAYITNKGYSNYHGMLVSLQKRFSNGFEFDVNYTWSHSLDNQSSIVNTVTGGLLCDITNVNACRGESDFDIRHLANANGIWELPFGRGRWLGGNMNKWADAIVGGWTLSGIVGIRSGLAINSAAGGANGSYPVSYLVASPAILNGPRSAFAGNVRDTPAGIQYFADQSAALAALRNPRHGEIGSRNLFRSPTFWNVDMGLSKKFKMPWSESHALTFRADAFNVTNTNSFTSPNLSLEGGSFGLIGGSLSTPREVQFALRYDF